MLSCFDPSQWCSEWKLEKKNTINSLDLSKPEEVLSWLVALLGRARSEKKSDKAAEGMIPAVL